MTGDDLAALALQTQQVYERNAARFDRERSRQLYERAWLDRLLDGLAVGAPVLDLGCGAGDPIAAYIRQQGFQVVGLDASNAMLAIARQRYPQGDWRLGDMRQLDLPERFDAIVGWDSFFHLTAQEQRDTLPRIAAHLNPLGQLMLTVGPSAGEVAGHVGDDPVYHASLAPQDYEQRLAVLGVEIVDFVKEDPAAWGRTVLFARKAGLPG